MKTMKYDIPSVEETVKNLKDFEDYGEEYWTDFLVQIISERLVISAGKINEDEIQFRITGNYPNNIVKKAEKLFKEKGWKELKVEKVDTALFFSDVTLKYEQSNI
jgi:hypothetical protein